MSWFGSAMSITTTREGQGAMIGELAAGTVVRLRNLEMDGVVGECLGSGGQGEVYHLSVGDGSTSRSFALKWYFPEWSTRKQWTDLVWLTRQAPPWRGP